MKGWGGEEVLMDGHPVPQPFCYLNILLIDNKVKANIRLTHSQPAVHQS